MTGPDLAFDGRVRVPGDGSPASAPQGAQSGKSTEKHPVDDALIARERVRVLDAIIAATNNADSLAEALRDVIGSICAGYPGLAGAVIGESGAEAFVDFEVTGASRTDWLALAREAECAAAAGTPERILTAVGPDPGSEPAIIPVAGGLALIIDAPPDHGSRRRLAFADLDDVVPLPRSVMYLLADQSAYVLSREVAAQQLKFRDAQFRAVFSASPLAQALMEGDNREFSIVNDALCDLVGYSAEELIGRSARTITHPDDIPIIERARRTALEDPGGQYHVERRLIAASGDIIFTETTLTWIFFPNGERMLLQQITDITAQRRIERELLDQAETDSLTGLPNRLRVVREISEIGHEEVPFAVLFLDIDGFKSINEARGHPIGDEVLVEVAARLGDITGDHCLLARFGGDEFAIVCRDASRSRTKSPLGSLATGIRQLAGRIQQSFAAPIETSAGNLHITASIGICDDTIPVSRPLDRLQYADTAAYQAKRLGEDRHVVYDSRLHQQTTENARIEGLLRTALDEGRLEVHYQPIVDIADGRPVGLEALVRMRDADGGLVLPGEFIGIAERSGLVVPMGAWVLAEATRVIAQIGRDRGVPARVSVNLSARQASRPGLVDAVLTALGEARMEARALTLEITESALLEADADTLRRLHGLRDRGVQIAIDDFGTGYSSLTYLRKLPVSRVKVDRSFVADMTTDPGDAAIVRAVTTLAADLGLSWVAEGIETAAQWRALRELGPGMGQGYFFGRPQPLEDIADAMHQLAERARS